ncbi:MAG: hypothetical protein AAFW73_13610 [Bacteroidota bacterium]
MPTVFTLSGLLIGTLLLMATLSVLWTKAHYRRFYLLTTALLLQTLFALLVIAQYTQPHNGEVFANADYHRLEHLGFGFRDSLRLVDSLAPTKALWDQQNGRVHIYSDSTGNALLLDQYFEPFFVERAGTYQLLNNCYPLDVSEGLRLYRDDQLLLELRIEADGKGRATYECYHAGSDRRARCDFDRELQIGYPLLDLIQKSGLPLAPRLEELLRACYLLRTRTGEADRPLGPLVFFPSARFHRTPGLKVAGATGPAFECRAGRLRFRDSLAYGQRFFTGIGQRKSAVARLERQEPYTHWRYELPLRYQLRRDSVNNLFVCSNYETVAQNILGAGFFYPAFERPDNWNHVNGDLRYYRGPAGEQLRFRLIDHQGELPEQAQIFGANEVFSLATRNRESQLGWHFQVADFRATNPLRVRYLYAFVLGFFILALGSLYLVSLDPYDPQVTRRGLLLETQIYLVMGVLLPIRIILQWRMSTFPPTEDIGVNTFALLRSFQHFRSTILLLLLFFVLRCLLLPQLRYWWRERWYRYEPSWVQALRYWWRRALVGEDFVAYVSTYLGALLVGSLLLAFNDRLVRIALPVGLYFFFYYYNRQRPLSTRPWWQPSPFVLFNALVALVYLSLRDAGFAVIFLLFLLLARAFDQYIRLREGRSQHLRRDVLLFVLASFGMALALRFGTSLIRWTFYVLTEFPQWSFALLLLALLAVLSYFLRALAQSWPGAWRYRQGVLRVFPGGLLLLGLLVVVARGDYLSRQVDHFSYVRFRAEIQQKPIDEILLATDFNSKAAADALRAAQNQWFINTYLEESKKNRGSYFTLQEHFNKGVSYLTQTTDLVVPRYLIAEHSEWLVKCLIVLWLALAFFFFHRHRLDRGPANLVFQLLLLLFTITYFIWLTATNRFIFFGQDLPVISLTSVFTLVLSFGIFVTIIWQAYRIPPAVERRSVASLHHLLQSLFPFAVILLLGLMIQRKTTVYPNKRFDVNRAISQVKSDVDQLNQYFVGYQQILSKNRVSLGEAPLDTLLRVLNDKIDYDPTSETLGEIIRSPFTKSIYDDFLQLPEKRDPNHILHLRRSVDGHFFFAVNQQFFVIPPPRSYRENWEGDLLAATAHRGLKWVQNGQRDNVIDLPDRLDRNFQLRPLPPGSENLRIAILPSAWTPAAMPQVLVSVLPKEAGAQVQLANNDREYRSHQFQALRPTLRMQDRDLLSVVNRGRVGFFLQRNPKNHLMRNLWINGRRGRFYPLGSDFLWAYHYSRAIETAYAPRPEWRDKDVQVSIDYELTRELQQLFAAHFSDGDQRQLALSVVDGQGRIRAIVDAKPDLDLIDPNDNRALRRRRRELYLNGNSGRERELNGNLNLLHMKIGPGSSIKPIIALGVTSQKRLPWRELRQVDVTATLGEGLRNPEMGHLRYYGGQLLAGTSRYQRKKFEWNLKDAEYQAFDYRSYLAKSSNLYHSLIVYLGAFPASRLERMRLRLNRGAGVADGLLRPYRPNTTDFPAFRFGEGPVLTFSAEQWPRSRSGRSEATASTLYFGNPASILADGLRKNFGLPTISTTGLQRNENFDAPRDSIFERSPLRSYCYPEYSEFFQINRNCTVRDGFVTGLVQATVGGYPLKVTPLKMAELSARMFRYDREYRLTLDDRPNYRPALRWDTGDWEGDYLSFYQEEILASLEAVVKTGGTAAFLEPYLRARRAATGYHYYAKTGTISASDREREDDKLFMITISKTDLVRASPEALRNNRFYTLYVAGYYFTEHDRALLEAIITRVENANLFKNYMNGTDSPGY